MALPGLQLEQEIVSISIKASSKLRSHRDYLTRRVKNSDKLETMFAVVWDSREVATARNWETRFAIHL